MEIIKPGTRFDFIGKQKPFLILSTTAVLVSIALVGILGLNYGVDFRGGSEIIVAFKAPVTTGEVREAAQKSGFDKADVQSFGASSDNRFLISIPRISILTQESAKKIEETLKADVGEIKRFSWAEEGGDIMYVRFSAGEVDEAKLAEAVKKVAVGNFEVKKQGSGERAEYQLQLQELQGQIAEKFTEIFGADKFSKESSVERVETVGPRVGQQLRDNGILSVLISLLLILIYVAFRFDIRYAPGAVIALFHDVAITLGVYAVLQLEVNLPIIAALLTIVGYSLNDTIVIFDRNRENFTDMTGRDIKTIVNVSVNDSLSRTILTSLTTLLAVFALFFFGGGLIQNFAFAMIVGIVVGTYSTVFIASPILIAMHNFLEDRKKTRASLDQQRQQQEASA